MLADHFACQWIDDRQLLDFITPKFDPVTVLFVRGPEFNTIASHAEFGSLEYDVVSLILDFDQFAEHLIPINLLSLTERHHHAFIFFWRTQSVDAGYAGHDDHIVSTDERAGRGQPQSVDLIVDRSVFFDINIPLGNISFGLVVVVVADKIVDRVVGKELFEFCVQLCRQCFVVGDHQRRSLYSLDNVGHRKRLAATCDAHETLVLALLSDSLSQFLDCLRLIAGRFKWCLKIKFHELRYLSVLLRTELRRL